MQNCITSMIRKYLPRHISCDSVSLMAQISFSVAKCRDARPSWWLLRRWLHSPTEMTRMLIAWRTSAAFRVFGIIPPPHPVAFASRPEWSSSGLAGRHIGRIFGCWVKSIGWSRCTLAMSLSSVRWSYSGCTSMFAFEMLYTCSVLFGDMLLMSCSPRMTSTNTGSRKTSPSSSVRKQWAAVKIVLLEMREPPHVVGGVSMWWNFILMKAWEASIILL